MLSSRLKLTIILVAAVIAAVSLLVSHKLVRDLLAQERSNMEVWAEAMRSLTMADEHTDLSLVLRVINGNHTIPVIVTDEGGNVLTYRNLRPNPCADDSLAILQKALYEMKAEGDTMRIDLTPDRSMQERHEYINLYYQQSLMVRRLSAFPYIQLGVIAFFFLSSLIALIIAQRAEQNRVWIGLSRETAHQLGTPISSLMAWSEMLQENYPDDPLLPELDKDIHRLQLIAERFSKIGSAPELTETPLTNIVSNVTDYLRPRLGRSVKLTLEAASDHPVTARVNAPLIEWVIENLCKNAVDAMEGRGHLTIRLSQPEGLAARIEVSDTGKGIPRNAWHKVFRPGFTTKRRGWGLGLSLAHRIITEYHDGRIYVSQSQPGQGTTFAIDLRK